MEATELQKPAEMPNVIVSMPIDLRHIIEDIANHADEFLEGASDRKQARAGIEEFITLEHPDLSSGDRKKVTDRVMAALEGEDFFGTEFVGDAFSSDERESED